MKKLFVLSVACLTGVSVFASDAASSTFAETMSPTGRRIISCLTRSSLLEGVTRETSEQLQARVQQKLTALKDETALLASIGLILKTKHMKRVISDRAPNLVSFLNLEGDDRLHKLKQETQGDDLCDAGAVINVLSKAYMTEELVGFVAEKTDHELLWEHGLLSQDIHFLRAQKA